MRSRWQVAGGAILVAGALAVPAGASAAITASGLRPCYTDVPLGKQTTITANFSGGIPGDHFMFVASVPGKGPGSAGSSNGENAFDANGNGTASIPDVFPPTDAIGPLAGERVDLSVEDFNSAGEIAQPVGSVLITNRALDVSSKPRNPRKARRVKLSGTQFAHKKVYGFVTNNRGTKVLRRFYIGKGNVCGYTTRKAVVAPRNNRNGTYRFYANAGRKLNKKRALSIRFRISRVL